MTKIIVIRKMSFDPSVSTIVELEGNTQRERYREVFPSQLADMVDWLAATQQYGHHTKVDTGTIFCTDMTEVQLYQYIEDVFPGGLVQFLEHFPRD